MTTNLPKSAAELALEAAGAGGTAEVMREQLPEALDAIRRQVGVLDALRAHKEALDTIRMAISPTALELALEAVRRHTPPLDQAQSLHSRLLSNDGLAQLDPLRDVYETLQAPLKLSDLKKRAVAARSPPVDASPSATHVQGSFDKATHVRKAPKEIAPAASVEATRQAAAIASAADIGRLIRETRERNRLSQQKLAGLANVGRRFLSELENGKPSLAFEKVIDVARALNIDLFARARR
jgi:y4mF family transcriptional regulator